MRTARNRRVAALAAVALGAGACTTTHQLGHYGEPETIAALREVANREPLQLVVPPEPMPNKVQERHPVTSIGPEGLRWELRPDESHLIPPESVRSVSTFDRGRGALEGALLAGPAVFVVSTVLVFLGTAAETRCVDGCEYQAAAGTALKAGALIGLGATVIGVGIGAYHGHEHRYVLER